MPNLWPPKREDAVPPTLEQRIAQLRSDMEWYYLEWGAETDDPYVAGKWRWRYMKAKAELEELEKQAA